MHKRTKFAAVGLSVTALGLAAGPAFAHPEPFDVSAGSAASGTVVSIEGNTIGTAPQIKFTDNTTGVTLVCQSASANGNVTVGTGLDGDKIAQITDTTWNNCTGPAGLTFKVTGYGTWYINVDDVTNGVATGTISNVRAHIESTNAPPPTCNFDVGSDTSTTGFNSSGTATVDPGSVSAQYTNSTQNLDVPATSGTEHLGLWNVEGDGGTSYCIVPSILNQGDSATFTGSYKLTADNPAYNPIAIN